MTRELLTVRRRVSVLIVGYDQDQWQLLHGRKIQTLMKRTGRRTAIAD